jgi:predicted dehydrogenase
MTYTPITLLVIGAGARGQTFARYVAAHPDQARIVGVAEPREMYRTRMAIEHEIAPGQVVSDWRELAERPRLADAVLIMTQDALHEAPAIAFAARGYDILLEKPMAPQADACQRIVAAAQAGGGLFAVCHSMRYTAYTRTLKRLLEAGAIGQIVTVQHLEPVGYWHQAHSFVRGNWRNEAESSFMLLAKSCHDIDWLRYIIGRRCMRVSSFGSLLHFQRANKPAEAGQAVRCLDCAHEPRCPYSAPKLYLGQVRAGELGWPVSVITPDLTEAGVLAALRTGPYGRCVYECDNDVVDHQVVNLEYEGGVTATFTMTAFTAKGGRETQIFGTHGELRVTEEQITHRDFVSDQVRVYDIDDEAEVLTGHSGGDESLIQRFIAAVAQRDPSLILSGPADTLETHLTVFAAERARREGRVIEVGSG